MNEVVFAIHLSVFASIGLLPRLFFRRDGSFHLRWFATAFPYAATPGLLVLDHLGVLRGWAVPRAAGEALELSSAALALCAAGLIGWTVRTHPTRIALWHQDNDAPASIVTVGPYAWVRHPFYAAFLLELVAAFLSFPHPGTLFFLTYGVVAMSITAGREERRLLASPFGADYAAYIRETARFVPWPTGGE